MQHRVEQGKIMALKGWVCFVSTGWLISASRSIIDLGCDLDGVTFHLSVSVSLNSK